jgi:large conductance mechanosensitive channel
MLKEFRDFAMRGSVVDLAIGIIIGSAFTSIVKSLVDDVIMPPIGLLLGNVDFSNLFLVLKAGKTPAPYSSLSIAQDAGAVTINYGVFINNVITFLIVVFVTFLLVRFMNRLYQETQKQAAEEQAEPTTKDCPYCKQSIAIDAVRCPYCTSDLELQSS